MSDITRAVKKALDKKSEQEVMDELIREAGKVRVDILKKEAGYRR